MSPQVHFEHIVCGVDSTPESLVAVGQAARLLEQHGTLRLIAAADVAKAAHAGIAAVHAADQLQEEAETALERARSLAPSAEAHVVDGDAATVLLREAEQAALLVVGSHGRGRTAGILLGTVAARALRDAPSSVLVAREARDAESWPRTVVVGVDGSETSAVAAAVARALAERFGATVRAVAAANDQLDREAARAIAPELEEVPGRAVDTLAAAGDEADLLIVGSRGLHGLKALGSVSERVAYQVSCSVLVVRTAPR